MRPRQVGKVSLSPASAAGALVLATALSLAPAGNALAQTAPLTEPEAAPLAPAATAAIENPQQVLEQKRQQLDAAQSKAQSLQSDVTDLDAERERLNARLMETAALIQRSEAQLTSIEGRLSELEAQEKMVRGSLGQRNAQIAQLLGSLQRMGRNPPPVLITKREDALQMVRSAMLLSSAFPELKTQALSLSERLNDLVRVMTDIRSEGDRLKAETQRLNEARTRLASLMEAKKVTIADRQTELASVRAASAEITKSVSDLSELIGKLDQAVHEKTALGSYEQELKSHPPALGAPVGETAMAATAPPVAGAAPSGPTVVIPNAVVSQPAATAADPAKETQVAALQPPKLKPPIVEIAPSGPGNLLGNPGRIKPEVAFASARGRLPLPVHGKRALAFGERTQYGGQSKGLVMETRGGAQVVAPCDGWILYAGEFRSYGQLLIINPGDGYHVLLAGLSQIDVQPGQFVLAAEPVGTMSGVEKASAPGNAPVLYIEFRKDGRPIDPDPWWVAGQQKVQG